RDRQGRVLQRQRGEEDARRRQRLARAHGRHPEHRPARGRSVTRRPSMAFEISDGITTTKPFTVTSGAAQLLSVLGASAKIEGKFDISDSIQIECEVGGEMTV